MKQKPSPQPLSVAKSIEVRDHLHELVGIGPKSLQAMETEYRKVPTGTATLTLASLLRQRADKKYALNPGVRRFVSNKYVDRLLEDCLSLLNIDSELAGYYHPEFVLSARAHGGACGIAPVRPSHHFSQPLIDAFASIRGNKIITNLGQSGCRTCGGSAGSMRSDELEEEGVSVLAYVGFSGQANPDSPYINYESYDLDTLTTEELGYLVVSTFDEFGVSCQWDEDPATAIEVNPPST